MNEFYAQGELKRCVLRLKSLSYLHRIEEGMNRKYFYKAMIIIEIQMISDS